jgi:uncharacterized cupin superfamily protein
MERAAIEAVEHVAHPMGVNSVRKSLSEALGTTEFGMVYYELEPGESFSGGLAHRHDDQEEVFYIVEGTTVFEIGAEREQVTVDAGEAIRVPPSEFQKGANAGDERVVALGLGAPGRRHDWEELDVLLECPNCEAETVHDCLPVDSGEWQAERIDLEATCQECGASISTTGAD